MIFLTEYKWGGQVMCGEVEAETLEEAEEIVAKQGYKERVVGVLIERIDDGGTSKRRLRGGDND